MNPPNTRGDPNLYINGRYLHFVLPTSPLLSSQAPPRDNPTSRETTLRGTISPPTTSSSNILLPVPSAPPVEQEPIVSSSESDACGEVPPAPKGNRSGQRPGKVMEQPASFQIHLCRGSLVPSALGSSLSGQFLLVLLGSMGSIQQMPVIYVGIIPSLLSQLIPTSFIRICRGGRDQAGSDWYVVPFRDAAVAPSSHHPPDDHKQY